MYRQGNILFGVMFPITPTQLFPLLQREGAIETSQSKPYLSICNICYIIYTYIYIYKSFTFVLSINESPLLGFHADILRTYILCRWKKASYVINISYIYTLMHATVLQWELLSETFIRMAKGKHSLMKATFVGKWKGSKISMIDSFEDPFKDLFEKLYPTGLGYVSTFSGHAYLHHVISYIQKTQPYCFVVCVILVKVWNYV